MRFQQPALALAIQGALLAGCGGGGGGEGSGGADGAVSISAANGQQVTRAVVQNSDAMAASQSSVASTFPTGVEVEGSGVPSVAAFTRNVVLDRLTREQAPVATVSGATVTESCSGGGTVSVSHDDRNGDNQVDVGETVSATFNSCVQNGFSGNGSLSFELTQAEGDYLVRTTDWAVAMSANFQDLTLSGNGEQIYYLDGGFALSIDFASTEGITTLELQGSSFVATVNDDNGQLNDFRFLASIDSAIPANSVEDYDFTYAGDNIGGRVTVETEEPFGFQGTSPPESGRATITGAGGSRALLEATGGGFARVSIDANGDGDFTDPDDRIITGEWRVIVG